MPPAIPPFDRYLIRLRYIKPSEFRFHPGFALHHTIVQALRGHPPETVLPFSHELGTTLFSPGEAGHWELTLVGDARSRAPEIAENLQRLRDGPLEPQFSVGLAGRFEVEGFERLPEPNLEAEVGRILGRQRLDLRFLSPLCLAIEPREAKPKFFSRKFFPADLFLGKLASRLAYLAGSSASSLELPDPVGVEADTQALFRLDVPSGSLSGRGGQVIRNSLMGTVSLRGVPEEWLLYLAAGQYLRSAGRKSPFGFNVYSLPQAQTAPRRYPARWNLDRAASTGVLAMALGHVKSSSKAAGIDGITPSVFFRERNTRLPDLHESLSSATYSPAPLLGVLDKKKSGGVRTLAIPTVTDRVAQRAALDVLQVSVDTLFEDCSHAYRRNYSRHRAAEQLQQAHRDGYRYLLDADITAFFDSIDRERLLAKWEALYPEDPLNALVRAWVEAPVVFRGKKLFRERGVPQGAPISPLLANLFLDELDEELLDRNYRIVRYADDFVVACRDLEEARRARDDAREVLSELGLSLHPRKTAVRSFEQGFGYLGFLFRGAEFADDAEKPGAKVALPTHKVPRSSWLAHAPLAKVRELVEDRRRVRARPLARSEREHGMPLYISDPTATIRLENERLVVELEPEPKFTYPIRGLSHVVLLGRVRATVQLLLELSEKGVPVYLCYGNGRLRAVFGPHSPEWTVWMAQARFAQDLELRLRFARSVVQARLHNLATTLVRRGFSDSRRIAREIRDLEKRCGDDARDLDSLRGLAGAGTALYFRAWGRSLGPDWKFERRTRRPPKDPVSALLSAGYTLLHNHLATAVFVAGLNPRIGVYHQSRGRHAALASDLAEEFRHLVERVVSASIHRREIRPQHFQQPQEGEQLCHLNREGWRRLVDSFEKALERELKPEGFETAVTYLELLTVQVRRVRAFILGDIPDYSPFRTRN